VNGQDARQLLARRLRALREHHWPHRKITQPELARVFGGVSVPLISSWESQTNPKIPPASRLDAYATFFATDRSVEQEPRLLSPTELTEAERRAKDELKRELMRLRSDAQRATGTAEADEISESLSAGTWRFEDDRPITIVCAQLPDRMLEPIPYTDPDDPDYVELNTYSDLDALFELHGHLRASNPTSQVNLRTAQQLNSDDYTTHLFVLGGVDWNQATRSVLDRLDFPVRQVNDWKSAEGPYFDVPEDGDQAQYRPRLEGSGEKKTLIEDVALFARAVNPFNRKRTVTVCSGMYGRGTYGVVRALTDARFRDRNTEYIRDRFAGSDAYCILTRIPVVAGSVMTPDWTEAENRLFEWSRTEG
jgi:hypothetical protein